MHIDTSQPLDTRIQRWLDSQPAGFSLSQQFYRDPSVYQLDLERV